MERIERVSRAFRVFFSVVLAILPVLNIAIWIFFNEAYSLVSQGTVGGVSLAKLPVPLPLPAWIRALGFTVCLIPLSVQMCMVYYLRRLFSLYARGMVFTGENVLCIRRTGVALLAGQALSPVVQALMTVVLTLNNPPGHRMVQIGLSSADLTAVAVGFMLIVVAWIMDEGRKLTEEQALVI